MDQMGQNLNRYYTDPDKLKQPSIFALRKLLDSYAADETLAMYLDLHAHASKKGCFIYGNVVDTFEDQVQNQLFCRLIAMNTPHFDYDGCLFSRDHMTRTDPGDGMTAEGSSRVSTYLNHRLIHSYTLECNYNTGKIGNEVVAPDGDLGLSAVPSAYRTCEYTTSPEKYTPMSWENVGQACMIAMLDLRGLNPCSRISKTKFRTLDRIRLLAVGDVRQLSEFRGCTVPDSLRRDNLAANMSRLPTDKNNSKVARNNGSGKSSADSNPTAVARALAAALMWRRFCPLPGEEPKAPAAPPPAAAPVPRYRRGSSASNGSSEASANAPFPAADKSSHKSRRALKGELPSQKAVLVYSGKSTPRSEKADSMKIEKAENNGQVRSEKQNIENIEFSRSGPVNGATPEKDNSGRAPRPTRLRSSNASMTVNELKLQIHGAMEKAEATVNISSPKMSGNEMSGMVAAARRGDTSALAEAIASGSMHPPPRPLIMMLKGKSGSGSLHPSGHHTQVPTTKLMAHRHSRGILKRDSSPAIAGKSLSDVDGTDRANAHTSSLDGDRGDAGIELCTDNTQNSALLSDGNQDILATQALTYPLRATKK